jgi:putative intracellular protease/amidase
MKAKALGLVSLLVIVAVFSGPLLMPVADGQEISEVKVLMLVTEAFGWNYFDAKDILESWGVNVTTAANALDVDVASCYNKPPRGTTADFLLNAVDNDIVTQFDALFIPSGGHWQSLIGSSRVLNFISYAHEHGVLIATTCIGNRVVAESNDIVNGTSVVNYGYTSTYMLTAGAEIRDNHYNVVIDNNIITGDSGGGTGGDGYLSAPTSEICQAIVAEALGYSYLEQAQVLPLAGGSGTMFNISADVTDLDTTLGSLSVIDMNITAVNARIFLGSNRTLIDTIELTDLDGDWTFEGSFTGSVDGNYVIDIEVEDTNSTLEVEREVASFTVGLEPTTTTFISADSILNPLVLGVTGVALVGVVVVIIFVKRR